MFEKEAKKWVKENTRIEHSASFGEIAVEPSAEKGFQKGAEFGYNKAKEDADKMKSRFLELCNLKDMRIAELEKANEWHYVKDGDLPKHENYVLVSNGKDWTKGFYKDKKWNIISLVGFIRIIAWKEIELPKESE